MSRIKNKPGTTPLLDATAPMPEPVARVVAIFKEDLEGVAFPDVSLESLEEAAEMVRERAAQVDTLRNRVAVAEGELTAARADLECLAERGLAYAKVYATGNAELTHKLESIKLAEAPKRKRRKSTKTEDNEGNVNEGNVAQGDFTSSKHDEPKVHLTAVG